MKHIQNYWNKVESAIASKTKAVPKNKGLLAPSKSSMSKDQPKTELDIIVNFVESIRQSREEMKNG